MYYLYLTTYLDFFSCLRLCLTLFIRRNVLNKYDSLVVLIELNLYLTDSVKINLHIGVYQKMLI